MCVLYANTGCLKVESQCCNRLCVSFHSGPAEDTTAVASKTQWYVKGYTLAP
jgi:hypothetical protein